MSTVLACVAGYVFGVVLFFLGVSFGRERVIRQLADQAAEELEQL